MKRSRVNRACIWVEKGAIPLFRSLGFEMKATAYVSNLTKGKEMYLFVVPMLNTEEVDRFQTTVRTLRDNGFTCHTPPNSFVGFYSFESSHLM